MCKCALEIQRLKKADFAKTDENDINTSGYIVDTLEAALWCFLTTESYRECVLKAVNLGRDTDTVACVAGSIAGLYYENVPDEWVNTLRNRKLIDEIAESFSAKCESCRG
ncbi:MAG: ADP-ribosylglycohydrolase family protein [Treponema sp.]|nr:ADP-ribosylglycohydrolase family protein [Treponema sp.]